MRWKTEQRPQDGDIKIEQTFALWPIETEEGYTVWLEHYWSVEEFVYLPSEGNGFWVQRRKLLNHPDRPDTGSTSK